MVIVVKKVDVIVVNIVAIKSRYYMSGYNSGYISYYIECYSSFYIQN